MPTKAALTILFTPAILVHELLVLMTGWLGVPAAVVLAAISIGMRAWWGLAAAVWLASVAVACFRSVYPTPESVPDPPQVPDGA